MSINSTCKKYDDVIYLCVVTEVNLLFVTSQTGCFCFVWNDATNEVRIGCLKVFEKFVQGFLKSNGEVKKKFSVKRIKIVSHFML